MHGRSNRRNIAVSVFKFFRFEERFRQAPFSSPISVNRRNEASFSNFSAVISVDRPNV